MRTSEGNHVAVGIGGVGGSYHTGQMRRRPSSAGLWVAMAYLAAAGLAVLFRRHAAALVVLLVALLIVASVGLSLLSASATQQEVAEQQVSDAVQPGEDPHHGPGG